MAKHPLHILELARKGAEVKYQELQSEIAALVRHFPHLRKGNGGVGKARRLTPEQGTTETAAPRRKRSKMSAAAKKAVSLRMKKYWARKTRREGKEIDRFLPKPASLPSRNFTFSKAVVKIPRLTLLPRTAKSAFLREGNG